MDCLKNRINSKNYCKAKEFRLWSEMINIIQKTQDKIKVRDEKRKNFTKKRITKKKLNGVWPISKISPIKTDQQQKLH